MHEHHARPHLSGRAIGPAPLTGKESVAELIANAFTAYNAGRLREGCELLVRKILQPDVTVGVSLSGALTPPGYGKSCLVPLIEAGFIDWMVSTGANLYHDTHHAIGLKLHAGSPFWDDVELRREGVVRIYDIVFDYTVLLETDLFYRRLLRLPEFQRAMSTPELHYRVGRYLAGIEERLHLEGASLLAAAWRHGVPIFTSSPGDSSIGMNVAELALEGSQLAFDVSLDVNLSAAIVWQAKERGGKSACWILGGGSPKNFMLQTEPQIQEVLGLSEAGHDYFLQVTDARPDVGGLSGATPGEAVSWGKVDPERLPDAVVVYCDSTIALPLLTHYALERGERRQPRRLYDRLQGLLELLVKGFAAKRDERIGEGAFSEDGPDGPALRS
ncbi:MAG TPA: deoxyhypusine synthase [Thermoanaerobaculia bacterium]|nr:deoxyhypusine synthase [Thermoanaerobaculia bacterium]